jgi:HAD superfamily phosphoserine phosphatase-like hydrolase
MGKSVAAYFDLDGTLLDASSEKTLTAYLGRKRPWRIPYGAVAWVLGLTSNLLRGRSLYDAARNRGHFSLASWSVLESFSKRIANENLSKKITQEAQDSLRWHKSQGHRVVLVTATIAPMAEAMGEVLGMDAVYGCGPDVREGILSGSERGWSVPRRKGKIAIVEADALQHGHELEECYGYGNTMADSWFMRITGHPVAINSKGSFRQFAEDQKWDMHDWKLKS